MNSIRRIPRRQLKASASLSAAKFHARNHLSQTDLPTFHFQGALPRLPIPDLEQSLEKYIESLEALEGHPQITKEDIERAKAKVKGFGATRGPELDKLLKDEDNRNSHTSFLWEPWTDMYLSDRRALPINYNPVLAWNQLTNAALNTQEARSAQICWATAKYFMTLADGHLEPEVFCLNEEPSKRTKQITKYLPKWRISIEKFGIKNQAMRYLPYANESAYPLDMSQIGNLFYSTRIPQPEKDVIQKADEKANHVIVLYRGRFYTLDVLMSEGSQTRHVRDVHDILSDIISIKKDADKKGDTTLPIAALSNYDRDSWTEARKELLELGNDFALNLIDSAMFCLTLDDYEGALLLDSEKSIVGGPDESKMVGQMLWGPARNRWVDKSFSVIVTSGGRCGLNFEHAWGDGACVLSYFNKVHEHILAECPLTEDSLGATTSSIGNSSDRVQEVKFKVNDKVKSEISRAIEFHDDAIKDLEIAFCKTTEITRKWIVSQKLAADAFLQLSLQLTHYELHGFPCATYESASTCAYQHGRTETIRPCTKESRILCDLYHGADYNDPETQVKIYRALKSAMKKHNNNAKECLMGEGFDRHIFGLRHQATKNGLDLPEFVTDPTFQVMNHFRMSTSTLNSPHVNFGGFGPVVPDGYALGYMVYDDWMGVIAATHVTQGVNAHDFASEVQNVWQNLRTVVDGAMAQ